MKNIGVIADPHANLAALEAVLEDMPRVDDILCAGDLVGYGPHPNEVVDLVNSKNIFSVLGNHDHAVVEESFGSLNDFAAEAARWTLTELTEENIDFLENLDLKFGTEYEDYSIFMAHGTPRNPLKEYLYPGVSNRALVNMTQGIDADVIVLGHTHVPLERMIQGRLVINPGAVGQPRDRNPDAGYMILKLGREIEVIHERVPYEIDRTTDRIKDLGLPEKLAMRLRFGW